MGHDTRRLRDMHTLKCFVIMVGFLLSCAFVREQQLKIDSPDEDNT